MVRQLTVPSPEGGSGVEYSRPWSVTKETVQPGAPETVSRAVTFVVRETASRSAIPACSPRSPVTEKDRPTFDDSAIQTR